MFPKNIREDADVYAYLEKRRLLDQYRKVKAQLCAQQNTGARFKKRIPKTSGIWYFRINRKYRAIGAFDRDGDFRVSYIDDHQ